MRNRIYGLAAVLALSLCLQISPNFSGRAADVEQPGVENADWSPSPLQLAVDLQSHLESISSQLPPLDRDVLQIDAPQLAASLQRRIVNPRATRGQIYAGLVLMHVLSDPGYLPQVKKYLDSSQPNADSGLIQNAIEGMGQWSVAMQRDPEARQYVTSAIAPLKHALADSAGMDASFLEPKLTALFDGTLSSESPAAITEGHGGSLASSHLKHYVPQAEVLEQEPLVPPAEIESAPQRTDLPFAPTRDFPLSRVAAIMEQQLASGKTRSEGDYRSMDAQAFFAGSQTRRMDTLLSRQAADPAQAMLEVIANAQDASIPGGRKVGRFGVGGLQVLGELREPSDRVFMETSLGDGRAAQFLFWKKDGGVDFDYRLVDSGRKGTLFRVYKHFSPEELRRREEFIERKLRANDRGAIVWASGEPINHPESFSEWGAAHRVEISNAAPVTVAIDASGYEIEDHGSGMGLKDVFERYLKPYGTDKPVSSTSDPARLFYRDAGLAQPQVSLGVAMVEIERIPISLDGRNLNLANDVFIDLPHDTDLTEDRGVISLVPADQSINGAIRGLRLLIDELTNPSIESPERFALINSLAALIRIKQPVYEKGVSRGDPKTATDLMWYLRYRLEASGLLDQYRSRGEAFVPNSPRWAPLDGLSGKIIFLDEDVFSPTSRDYAAAGFEPLPPSLTQQPAWKVFASRPDIKFFMRDLRKDGALAIVSKDVVVIDKSLAQEPGDPEVLVARIEREMSDSVSTDKAGPKSRFISSLAIIMRRAVRPIILAAALAAVPGIYHYASAALSQPPALMQQVDGAMQSAFYSQHYARSGNDSPPGSMDEISQDAERIPRQLFGSFNSEANVDEFFITGIKSTLLANGDWSDDDARWANAKNSIKESAANRVQISYLMEANGQQRLLNQSNGRIANITLKDAQGKSLSYRFDPQTDELSANGYSGSARVSYDIYLSPQTNALSDASAPLPANELQGFPRQWRQALYPLKNASDQDKQRAIERLMAQDFVYDYSQPYSRDWQSWSHTAQRYLDKGEPIPIICNTSSLYYYLMARYVGLPAAYVELADSYSNGFYLDLAGHAKVLIKVGNNWRFVETTSLMPLVVAAPSVIAGGQSQGVSAEPSFLAKFLREHGLVAPSWLRGMLHKGSYTPRPAPYNDSGPGAAIFGGVLIGVLVLLVGGLFALGLRSFLRTRKALSTLRQALPMFGWRRERLPLRWLNWSPLINGQFQQRSTPWGTLYRKKSVPNQIYMANTHGGLWPVSFSDEVHINNTSLAFTALRFCWRGLTCKLIASNGPKQKTIYESFWAAPDLLPAVGPRRYALFGKKLIRVNAEAGSYEKVANLSEGPLDMGSTKLVQMESLDGTDRFAIIRWANRGKTRLRFLSISGNRAQWDGPMQTIDVSWNKQVERKAWMSGQTAVCEFSLNDKEKPFALYVQGQGEIPAQGAVQAVLGGKIFSGEAGEMRAYDIAAQHWGEATLDNAQISPINIKQIGEDLFFIRGIKSGKTRGYLCDSDGDDIREVSNEPSAAVRIGDAVYYRQDGNESTLYAATKERPVREISLNYNPKRLYSEACARVTGLDASLFSTLDSGWRDIDAKFIVSKDARALRRSINRDKSFINRLEPELIDVAPYQAAMMPQWSLARLFLSPEAADIAIEQPILSRLDQIARANIERPQWLRDAFDLVDRVYRLNIGSPSKIAGHYLDLIESLPDILDDLRRAVLEPALLPSGLPAEPLGYLNDHNPRQAQELPPLTQLYLQMLKDGPESLLRREPDNAPKGPPRFSVETRDESLSRLIGASQKIPAEPMDAGGLEGFTQVFNALTPPERADLSSVRGVVMNQGLSAPFWIRELIQNARDAVREARRAGQQVPAEIKMRSFLSEDGSRWMVSVQDGVGMKLSRFLKALLVPEATTKTLADEVNGFLSLGGSGDEKIERLLSEFFDDAARTDAALLAFLKGVINQAPAQAAHAIADRWSERMKKGGAGFFGIGFFTVFGGADEVIVRTGAGGLLREASLTPVRDQTGRLTDIHVGSLRDYNDPNGTRKGTEVLRVKNVTPENLGRLLIENAYVHIMAGKYAGAVSDLEISINAQSIRDGLETLAQKNSLRSRLTRGARPRWTVDELFVQEPPLDGLSLIPREILSALLAAGWNIDFPAATAVVRTRASVQSPERYAPATAALALPAAYRLYRDGVLQPSGMPAYAEYRKISPWDSPPLAASIRPDVAAISTGKDDARLWERYKTNPSLWSQLMLALCDDKEQALRRILGPELCHSLDEWRQSGEPLRVGPLPAEGSADYENAVRALHSSALAKAKAGETDFDHEPAAAGLAQILLRLSSFMTDPPPFIAAGISVWEALRRYLDEGASVPLMEAVLEASGRTSDAEAVRLFEGWLKNPGTKKELEKSFLSDLTRAQIEPSLAKLWRAASRGKPALISLRRQTS